MRRAIASVEESFEGRGKKRKWIGRVRKLKLWNKPQALELLGKYIGAFGSRLDDDERPLSVKFEFNFNRQQKAKEIEINPNSAASKP